VKRLRREVTTDASGNAEVFAPIAGTASGKIHSICYVKDGSTPFDNGVDFAITLNTTGENVWTESNVNASTTRYPRAATHKEDGAAYAGGDLEAFREPIAMGRDKVKITISSGGNTKKGVFHVLLTDER